ncbi:hypothetical protein FKP32DRAFT_1613971 [Trametes sanguinea]|nr:hypothetical protein FKP32DRAFT_1613971 [Trametes sanguinea]
MLERSPSPQKQPETSDGGPCQERCEPAVSASHVHRLFSPGGKYTDPYPIIFKVPTEDLADEVLRYQEAIKAIAAAPDVYESVRLVYTLPIGDDILKDYVEDSAGKGLYPVSWGNECAVFTNVDDARSATKGVAKPIWRKVPSFKRAVACMITGGESEKRTDRKLHELLVTHVLTAGASGIPHTKIEEESYTPPATPRRQRGPFSTPSHSPQKPRVELPHTLSQPPALPSADGPLLSELTYDISLAELSVGGDAIYQHTRNLRGIKNSHTFPAINLAKVPSCGPALDMYLQALGYDIESKLAIAYACRNSSTMEAFVLLLSYRQMVLFGKGKRMAARREAAEAQRKYVTRLARKPYRARPKVVAIKKTPAERKALAEQRAERRQKMAEAITAARDAVAEEAKKIQETFGLHSDKYYEQQILQHSRVASTKRKTNPWNAFLRSELQKRNDALPPGAPRFSSSDKAVISEISAKWQAMSKEEKEWVKEDLVKDLDEVKEMKALAVQSVPISAFHDARATLDSVFEELRRLHARTGIEIGLIAVRSARSQFTPPITFGTSSNIHDFFQVSVGTSLDDVAGTFEAYCLSGVSGLVQRSMDINQGLQSRLTAIINQKLGEATQFTARKMIYIGFAEHITVRHGIIIENWPIPRFVAPSSIRTRLELTTLLNAWETGMTRFRKLSRDEWMRWEAQRTTGSADGPAVRPVTLAPFVTPEAPPTHPLSQDTTARAGTDPSLRTNEATLLNEPGGAPYLAPAKPRKTRSDLGQSHKKRKGRSQDDRESDSSPERSDDEGPSGTRHARGSNAPAMSNEQTAGLAVVRDAPGPADITAAHPPTVLNTAVALYASSNTAFQPDALTPNGSATALSSNAAHTAAGGGASSTHSSTAPDPAHGATFVFPHDHTTFLGNVAVPSTHPTSHIPQHAWNTPDFVIDPALLNLSAERTPLTSGPPSSSDGGNGSTSSYGRASAVWRGGGT